ncbi:MAG: hypothetical protein AB8I08_06465 [Sandaracinaceae bacterium]
MTPRIRAAGGVGLLLVLCVAGVLGDAALRRAERDEQDAIHAAVVDTIGLPDLALSSSARWLRHPSQAEAGAAMSDLPASLDVDPAGALIGPPRRLLRVGGVEVVRR